tara:strand:- start:2733 stop:3371 length:639 start_codon:yes stop_codon:yes gene_type:complete
MKTKSTALCLLVLGTSTLSGCLTPKAIQATRYYTVSHTSVTPGETISQASLGLRPFVAARPYKLEMAYRAATNRLGYYSRSEWAELPGTVVSRAVFDNIVKGNLYQDAGEATAMAHPDFIFTGELRRFETDYTGDSPEFVVAVSASIRSTLDGARAWQDQIEVRTPLNVTTYANPTDDTLLEIARAASEAVSALSQELTKRVRVTLSASTPK